MPYLPDVRQYRSFAASNFQPIEQESTRDGDDKSYKVRGYFCTFNDEYLLYPAIPSCDWPATYEQIDRHAFDECDVSDVIAQYDHSGDVLARTRNGSLKLGFDDHGGYCEMRLDGCQRARDMYESISNGLVVEMSFGFVIADDDEGEGRTYTRDEQGDYHVTITRISKQYDVSCVSIPANPGTDIESVRKRSYMAPIIEADIEARKKLKDSEEAKSDEAIDHQPEETRSSQAENSIEDVTVDGESYEGVEDVTDKSYKGLTVEAVVEGFDIEDMATRIASILAERSAKEVGEKLSEPEQEVSEPVSDSKARRMRRARALQLSHI